MTMRKGKVDAKLQKVSEEVRKLAMAFPETQEDHPWEHSAFKVKKKTFVFMALDADGLRLSFKLDQSLFNTLALPMCEPTGYGLGKSGWVTASFESGDNVPMSHVERWINESFRLIAPKTMVKQLDASPSGKKSNDKTSPSKAGGAKDEAKETVKTIAKKSSAKKSSAKTTSSNKTSANSLTTKAASTEKTSVKTSTTRTVSTKKPSVETSTTKTASAKKPRVKTSTTKTASAKKPSVKTSTTKTASATSLKTLTVKKTQSKKPSVKIRSGK